MVLSREVICLEKYLRNLTKWDIQLMLRKKIVVPSNLL